MIIIIKLNKIETQGGVKWQFINAKNAGTRKSLNVNQGNARNVEAKIRLRKRRYNYGKDDREIFVGGVCR